MQINTLFHSDLKAFNIGAPTFAAELKDQGYSVVPIKWSPPAQGDPDVLRAMDRFLYDDEVRRANEEAVGRIMAASPILVGIETALDVVPGMTGNTILHSGPPVTWENMCDTMQGAVVGALIYEGMAADEAEARKLAASGDVTFSPCHEHSAVGPMSGVISPSMPVHIVENKAFGNRAYCTVNEGLGKVLRFGAFDDSVVNRLKWIQTEYAPTLKKAIALTNGGIELKVLIAQAVQMGDECHNRNKAATSLFVREIVPYLLRTDCPADVLERCILFICGNDHYFLNLSMPACKSALDAAHGVAYSTVVTAMARNGVEFGIKVSGLDKDQWFTAPANMVKGLLFPGYTEADACPDLGDSAITETMGIGGFAMGTSPAIVQFVGGSVSDALGYSRSMYAITTAENKNFSLPPLDFRGVATGIDLLKVAETGILPVINTGIAHRRAGVGQIGAGIVNPPMECFSKAIKAFDNHYGATQ